jgi:ATP-dependent DNA helicase RecG
MLSKEELQKLLTDLESDRVERTESTKNTDKFSEAICAFANDFPNHKKNGYLLLGVKDDGSLSGLKASDELLKDLAAIRHNGQILPQPAMTVQKYEFEAGEIVVVEVFPAYQPPVRYRGRIWIRTGPSKSIANETEERILIEKRSSTVKTFDAQPEFGANLEEISLERFKLNYLPLAIDRHTLLANNRETKTQLASLRFYDLIRDCPTNAGILVFGLNPLFYLPGAYVQYVRFTGDSMTSEVANEKQFSGSLIDVLKELEDFLKNNILIEKPVPINGLQEQMVRNYPLWALRELMMNAVMHRDYQSNAPIYLYEFADRIEIINSGGLYGDARPDNFPNVSDYRNPVIAEVMKTLGYVNRFNIGIRKAQEELAKNGNPPAVFETKLITKFSVKILINPNCL